MSKYAHENDFSSEVERAFAFLKPAFVGPEKEHYSLYYSNGLIGIYVGFDDRDGRVITGRRAQVGERNVNASLQCLYVAAGLGPAQDVRDTARSRKQLSGAIDSQATALRTLLPILEGPTGANLLGGCHGR